LAWYSGIANNQGHHQLNVISPLAPFVRITRENVDAVAHLSWADSLQVLSIPRDAISSDMTQGLLGTAESTESPHMRWPEL
jgi:hypothetical protein